MRSSRLILIFVGTAAIALHLGATRVLGASTAFKRGDWTIQADTGHGELSLRHRRLGIVAEHVRLLDGPDARRHRLSGWSASIDASDRFVIKTKDPQVTWGFQIAGDAVLIASTSPDTVLTAEAPASDSRIVVRPLDKDGFPVVWQGTSEVKRDFGGSKTQRASYLPRENPECMYFSLGQISGRGLHALFDRSSDTVIEFGAAASLVRDSGDLNSMRVSVPVPGSAILRVVPDYYTKVLGLPFYKPFDDSYFKTAPIVWSSWTSYYQGVTEDDMVKNTDWLARNLKPYGFRYVQLDDGYDRGRTGEHTWIDQWDAAKFPHGPRWLTDYIRSKGLSAGIWLVPNAYAGATKDHPDWYLRDRKGKWINDYSTPSLDSSNPEVLKLVDHIFEKLDDWGFDYYKLDGEFSLPAYDPSVDKTRLHDQGDPVAIYRKRLASIRSVIGPHRFLEDCPSGTPLNGIGYASSVFNGEDLFANWQGMYNLFSSISANAFLNHLAVYLMPGEGLELSEPMPVEKAAAERRSIFVEQLHGREDPVSGVGLSDAEARTLLTYVSLTGVTYPLASVMQEIPEKRVAMLKATMPTLPILPVDLFSRGTDMEWDTFKHVKAKDYLQTYPQILDLKVNGVLGEYDVVGLTNWTEAERTMEVAADRQLGLPGTEQLLAMDFWGRELLSDAVTGGKLSVKVAPHDTKVLLVHSDTGHPQVMGTSRHISGAYSLDSVEWRAHDSVLSGVSRTIVGEPYVVWIHVPEGAKLKSASAKASGSSIDVSKQQDGSLLSLQFTGTDKPVTWTAQF